MTELLGRHCNYVAETTNISLEDKLFERPNVKIQCHMEIQIVAYPQ